VARLRRRAIPAVDISAAELIDQLRRHWRTVHPVDRVAEELPVAAWVLMRKTHELLQDPDPADVIPSESAADRAWVEAAAAGLLQHAANLRPTLSGPPRWPEPTWPPIVDAHPWRLPLAWPPGRPARPQPLPTLVTGEVPLWSRALELLRRVRRAGASAEFGALVQDLPIDQQVEQFVVMVALWARGRLDAAQPAPFGPLKLALVTRRRRAGAAPRTRGEAGGHDGRV
jgi:chromatin segregation and condensation protein Rec8/ScpA/Scc1 (kleisin family)